MSDKLNESLVETSQFYIDAINEGPQVTGILDTADLDRAVNDPLTVVIDGSEGKIPLITPVIYQEEANQSFFENQNAYYFNWTSLPENFNSNDIAEQTTDKIKIGDKIYFEMIKDKPFPENTLRAIIEASGKTLVLDENVFDKNNESLAAVIHYCSELRRQDPASVGFDTMKQAFEYVRTLGKWEEYGRDGIFFVAGRDVNEELIDEMWRTYDETFDDLVENHPSAQKQPRDFFEEQLRHPLSNIVYARDDSGIVSELFMMEDVEACTWLNHEFYRQRNPEGETIYLPGISTRLDRKGLHYSPRLIRAMSIIAEHVPDLTSVATQCTNRSAEYIPRLANENTIGSTNLHLEETFNYQFPVYKVV